MQKQSIIFILLSILVVLFARYAHLLITYIQTVFIFVNYHLAPVFGYSGWGSTLRKISILILLPLILAAIPALTYRLIKGSYMPHFIPLVWMIWIVLVLSTILLVR